MSKRGGLLRFYAFAAALCLLLPLAVDAQQALSDAQGKPLALGSQCVFGGELLILTREGLYNWRPEEASARMLAAAPQGTAIHWLLSDGARLFGLDTNEWLLYPLTLNGGALAAEAPLQLESDLLEDPLNRHMQPLNALVQGDRLYLLFHPEGTGGWHGEVHAFGLTDGRGSKADLSFPQWFTRGPDESLLVLSHDYRGASATADTADDYAAVQRYDPATGEVERLFALGQPFEMAGGPPLIVWDADNGELLYTVKDGLYRRKADGTEGLVARIPTLDVGASGAPVLWLPGGSLALASRGQALVMSPQDQASSAAARPLTVYGVSDQNLHERTMAGLPGQSARLVEAFWQDAAMLGQQLQSGASDLDVLFLSSHQDEVGRMAAKGYLMDLSGHPAIRTHVDKCYPAIAESARASGGIYLLPIAVDSTLYTFKPHLFEELGLTVPRTFQQMADYLQAWDDDAAQRFSQYLPLAQGQPRREMMTEAVRAAFAQQARQGEAYRFDDPLLEELLRRAMALNLSALELGPDDYSFMNKPSLMQQTNLSLGFISTSDSMGAEERVRPLLIQPTKDLPAVLPLRVDYLAVYAASDNQEAALKYLQSALASMEHESKVKLYPDCDEPMQTPGIDEVLARHNSNVERLEHDLAQAQGAQKTELARQLDEARRVRDEQETFRWRLSPEVIGLYRGMMRHFVIVTRDLDMLYHEPHFRGLMDRLYQGHISLEQFIGEAQGRLRLMQLENNE